VSTLAGTALSTGSRDGTGAQAQFNSPNGIAVTGAGLIYVTDFGNDTVRQITAVGDPRSAQFGLRFRF